MIFLSLKLALKWPILRGIPHVQPRPNQHTIYANPIYQKKKIWFWIFLIQRNPQSQKLSPQTHQVTISPAFPSLPSLPLRSPGMGSSGPVLPQRPSWLNPWWNFNSKSVHIVLWMCHRDWDPPIAVKHFSNVHILYVCIYVYVYMYLSYMYLSYMYISYMYISYHMFNVSGSPSS